MLRVYFFRNLDTRLFLLNYCQFLLLNGLQPLVTCPTNRFPIVKIARLLMQLELELELQ